MAAHLRDSTSSSAPIRARSIPESGRCIARQPRAVGDTVRRCAYSSRWLAGFCAASSACDRRWP